MSKDKKPEELIVDIQEACSKLGWVVSMTENESGMVTHLIIGVQDSVEELLSELPSGDQYEIWEKPVEEDFGLH